VAHLVRAAVFHYTLEVRFHCESFAAEVQLEGLKGNAKRLVTWLT
jgi:hypothetical protein